MSTKRAQKRPPKLKFSCCFGCDGVTAPPDGIDVPRWDRNNPFWEAVMSELTTVCLDLAKNVFQAHGADASGRTARRKKLRRDQGKRQAETVQGL